MASSSQDRRSACPVGFEPMSLNDDDNCPTVEDVKKRSLWLIKVPHDFDASSLSGQNVVLNGSQDLLRTDQDTTERYEIWSKTDDTSQLSSFSLLLPSSKQKSICAAGSLHGQMNVVRSVVVPPCVLPPTPPPVSRKSACQIARKWIPFGHKNPRKIRRLATNEMETQAEKKKKKKESKKRVEDSVDAASKRKTQSNARSLDASELSDDSDTRDKHSFSSKKKDKKQTHTARVKTEPTSDSEIVKDSEQKSASSPKKRKKERGKNNEDGVDSVHPTSKHIEEDNATRVDLVKVKTEFVESESPGKRARKHKSVTTDCEKEEEMVVKQKKSKSSDEFNLTRVKIEPPEDSPSKSKKKHRK